MPSAVVTKKSSIATLHLHKRAWRCGCSAAPANGGDGGEDSDELDEVAPAGMNHRLQSGDKPLPSKLAARIDPD